MLSIKAKIVIAYTMAFGVLLSIFAFVIYRGMRQAAVEKLDVRLKSYSGRVQDEMEEAGTRWRRATWKRSCPQ